MYKPQGKIGKRGIPILSKVQIDEIAENFIKDFRPDALENPTEIDIDRFATFYLELEQDFQYLSHNGVYLGMTVFKDTDRIPVYDIESGEAKYISAKARTVIVDSNLLENNQEHRYRYTMGHECGHDIFHKRYFQMKDSQDADVEPMMRCGRVLFETNRHSKNLYTDKDWVEWQANYMSAALLMPKSMVFKLVEDVQCMTKDFREAVCVIRVADIFNVSEAAAMYRLKSLGIVDKSANLEMVMQKMMADA